MARGDKEETQGGGPPRRAMGRMNATLQPLQVSRNRVLFSGLASNHQGSAFETDFAV